MNISRTAVLAAASALFVSALSAAAQEQAAPQQGATQQQAEENWDPNRPLSPEARKGQASDFPKGEMKNLEPVVPAGPAVGVPGGPAVVPMVALERLEGVETVTLDTPQGPVVVISWPVSGNVTVSDYNVNFSAMDANRDGYISREEAQAMADRSKAAGQLSRNFAQGDVNNDGRLSMSEVIDWIY